MTAYTKTPHTDGVTANSATSLNNLETGIVNGHTEIASQAVATGIIMVWGSPNIPNGWVKCNGQMLDGRLEQNLNLWNLITTTFGGSGQSSFAVPDMRGVFPRGAASGATGRNDDGRLVGPTVQTDTINLHGGANHTQNDRQSSSSHASYGAAGPNSPSNFRDVGGATSGNPGGLPAGATAGNESRPKNIGMYYIIKL